MQTYRVRIVDDAAALDTAEKLYVNQFRVGAPEYRPNTTAQLVFLRDRGLLCRMETDEKDLRAEVTEFDGDTYQDSCMEFFINFAPEKGTGYINLEGNPIGTLHCKFGSDRYVRRPLTEFGCTVRPTTQAEQRDDGWSIRYFIPMELIRVMFGKESLQSGDVLHANFYKCGDLTAHPHYGMWNPVELEKLDFHRPDFFGRLILE